LESEIAGTSLTKIKRAVFAALAVICWPHRMASTAVELGADGPALLSTLLSLGIEDAEQVVAVAPTTARFPIGPNVKITIQSK
jgi:hypothetical protein